MDESRRKFLKLLATAPVAVSFGFAGEALMRYSKPTMRPFGVFDPADLPTSANREVFNRSELPVAWTFVPFVFHMKIAEFNAEQNELREIPGFLVRLSGDEIAAFSRVCPRGCRSLILEANPGSYKCSCPQCATGCCCTASVGNPVLICPTDGSVFDPANNASVLCGPAHRPPHRFNLDIQDNTIAVVGLELGSIR